MGLRPPEEDSPLSFDAFDFAEGSWALENLSDVARGMNMEWWLR
jgi:hypothetical protein